MWAVRPYTVQLILMWLQVLEEMRVQLTDKTRETTVAVSARQDLATDIKAPEEKLKVVLFIMQVPA